MKQKINIGLTVHNFENPQTLVILNEIIRTNIELDFIIYHQKYYKRKIIQTINNVFGRNSINKKQTLQKIRQVKIYNISNINSISAAKVFKKYCPSLIICNTGIISNQTINNNPDIYFINTHGSKLPKYRGVSNLQWALWYEDDIYASVHRINHGIDEGDILYQELIVENKGDILRSGKLSNLSELIAKSTCKAINLFINGKNTFVRQENLNKPLMQYYSMHPILLDILDKKYLKRKHK